MKITKKELVRLIKEQSQNPGEKYFKDALKNVEDAIENLQKVKKIRTNDNLEDVMKDLNNAQRFLNLPFLIKEEEEGAWSASQKTKKPEKYSTLQLQIRQITGLKNLRQIDYLIKIIMFVANIMLISPFDNSKFNRLIDIIDKNFKMWK